MKTLYLLILLCFCSLTYGQFPGPGGLISNPGFVKDSGQCHFGMSDPVPPPWGNGCQIKASPWFCAHGTSPDGYGICDSVQNIVSMPVNQHGNFAPAVNGLGLALWYPVNDPLFPEWSGCPLDKPIPARCSVKVSIMLKISNQSRYTGGFFIVLNDTVTVTPAPVNSWQNITAYFYSSSQIDTLFIGGHDNLRINKPGWMESFYLIIGHVSVTAYDCNLPMILDPSGNPLPAIRKFR